MPIYEYLCSNCGCKVEKLLKISESKKEIRCMICLFKMKKVISLSSFALRGNCWSKDGYTKDKKPVKSGE